MKQNRRRLEDRVLGSKSPPPPPPPPPLSLSTACPLFSASLQQPLTLLSYCLAGKSNFNQISDSQSHNFSRRLKLFTLICCLRLFLNL
ncbi:hypothetical protein RchiOBHm_Chr2g0103531 [Rosa chinensis]|uniref:Uncharacterized protein n=1 Tax=Rosa chinensis TaxID=74649 RepID=A0A2P6RMX1_ROSCH|nr:hypothetical protein RchiOBHm_Chr2g0103531 [Rosa chinensis]